ncbi:MULTISPECIES: outer membrane beta-barrel family protein [Hydrotalea]|jgi:hypothetical protein|uniref:Outer membrane receptor protein involved in Fe transport n=2 Tax=Hydrotalea TaxID=1004300 RepID=A0A2W7RGU3_9BACT|nr:MULTISPECIES: outer membrane beta-barrel family protein [Hydrotalea]PZX59411.1 outer membrane receptor protein involved in Fe transport [Hydrotalea sandarakina]RWZ86473.1 MAG: TonB-dependent receptor [Hydrotalea sp. AMD]
MECFINIIWFCFKKLNHNPSKYQYIFIIICFIIVFVLFNLNNVFGQSLKGKIVTANNTPIEFVTVSLLKDTINLENTITDSNGVYRFTRLKIGHYKLSVSHINYENKETAFNMLNDTIINVMLFLKSKELKEIAVSGKKPLIQRKVDRIIFNVENSLTAIGSNALEAISKAPGVRVINNTISLVGKSKLAIMFNGRLSQLTGDDLINYLKSTSANDISTIEVITNPPAKYDAEGNSGLINIITKKNTQLGYNCSVQLGDAQSTYNTLLGGVNLNYNKEKNKLYTLFNAGNGSTAPIEKNIIFYPTQTWKKTNNRRDYNRYITGTIGYDYQPNAKTAAGFNYSFGALSPNMKEAISTPIYNLFNTIDSSINTNANSTRNINYQSVNIHFENKIDSVGKKITIDGDWYFYQDNNERKFTNENYNANGELMPNTLTQYLSGSKQNINLYTLNIVADLPFKAYKISVGGKLSFINNKSDVSFYQRINNRYAFDNSNSNNFIYNENTQAIFANFSKTIKKFDFQVGLRSENTGTTGISQNNNQTTKNSYFKFFPTAYITYNLNDMNSFSLSYGKRINRPSYYKLNPFKWYTNSYSYSEGNPFLQPSFNNNFEISHTYNNFLTTALSVSNENNRFDQITIVQNNTNLQITKYLNFLKTYTYQLSSSVFINKINWLETNNQFQIFYSVSKSSLPETKPIIKGWGGYVSSDNQIVFNKVRTILGELNFWYQFPYIDGLDKSSGYYNIDAAIKFLVHKKKLQVTISGNDILKSNKPIYYSLFNNIKQQNNNYYDNQQINISILYKFGNQKIKKNYRQINNSEETKRIN